MYICFLSSARAPDMQVERKKNTGGAGRAANPAFDFGDWNWKLISLNFLFGMEIVTPLVCVHYLSIFWQ